MKNSPTEVKKKETEERKRQEELEKQKRNETYQLLGGSQNDSDADDDSSLDGNIQQLENYSYFDGDKILESLKLAPKDRKKRGSHLSPAENECHRYFLRLRQDERSAPWPD